MSAAESLPDVKAEQTPEAALADAFDKTVDPTIGGWGLRSEEMLTALRAEGWDVIRAPPDIARIREQAFAAGIAFAEEGHAAGQGRATVRGIAP